MSSEGEKHDGRDCNDTAALREKIASAEAEIVRLRESLVRAEEQARWLMGVVERMLPPSATERADTVAGARVWLWMLLAVVSGAAVAVGALRALGLW